LRMGFSESPDSRQDSFDLIQYCCVLDGRWNLIVNSVSDLLDCAAHDLSVASTGTQSTGCARLARIDKINPVYPV
jgi:hypothetical protein